MLRFLSEPAPQFPTFSAGKTFREGNIFETVGIEWDKLQEVAGLDPYRRCSNKENWTMRMLEFGSKPDKILREPLNARWISTELPSAHRASPGNMFVPNFHLFSKWQSRTSGTFVLIFFWVILSLTW